jgi:hypothetical protein
LMSRAISSADRPSKSSEAGFRASVVRCSSMNDRRLKIEEMGDGFRRDLCILDSGCRQQ